MASLTLTNLETRVMNALRIPTTNTTEAAKVDAVINMVYREICGKYDFFWLTKRQTIVTTDDITTGTISLTKGSVTGAYSSAPAISTTGRILYVSSNAVEDALFRISAHTAGDTALTLVSAYTGATASAASYNVYQDTYDLASDMGKVLHIRRYGYPYPLKIVGFQEMANLKGFDRSEGPPQLAAIHDYDTSGDPTSVRQLIVHPFPEDLYTLEISYRQALNTELSGSTRPLIPDDWLHVLEWGALAAAYPILLNDPVRGTFYHQKYVDALNLMVARHREWEDAPQVSLEDDYRGFFRRSRRIGPGRMDMGNYFDRWPYEP